MIIPYVRSNGKKNACLASHIYPLPENKATASTSSKASPSEDDSNSATARWANELLRRAYAHGAAQRKKRIKVLINPHGGKGNAGMVYRSQIAPIFKSAGCTVDVEVTEYRGHAVQIAERLDINKYDVVACCSGDGLPHEVFNGLGRRSDARTALRKIAVTNLPGGSGNGMCHNLNGTDNPTLAALSVVKGKRMPMDLVSITQGDNRYLSFLSQSTGSIAEADLGTESLRWMGGARFTVGVLRAIALKRTYPCDVAVVLKSEDKAAIRQNYQREWREKMEVPDGHGQTQSSSDEVDGLGDTSPTSPYEGLPFLRYGTVNDPLPPSMVSFRNENLGTLWGGNMSYMSADSNVFPAAMPADGVIDVVTMDGNIPRREAIMNLLSVEKGTFFDRRSVTYRKAEAFRVTPCRSEGAEGVMRKNYISVDGEDVPFAPFQAEVHQGLGTVLSKNGKVYETGGLKL